MYTIIKREFGVDSKLTANIIKDRKVAYYKACTEAKWKNKSNLRQEKSNKRTKQRKRIRMET